ncbi:MAG: HD domain-containing protein [Spirochaetaceae bacterium]|nr:MAG: HD domain-containing protein [Spirochaetaceae bacterium]
MRIPRVVKDFSSFFSDAGFQCYLVGGAVRDMLLGRKIQDFDIASDALPKQVTDIFRRVIPTGIKHGTVTVLFKGTRFEVTTFRIDQEYRDGRRPDSVVFSPSIQEDLKRRDFTINAMAYDLIHHQLLDPHGGRKDLKAGIIRAIGDPFERFQEDGLRPLRACRFAAQFGFTIEEGTFASIPTSIDTVKRVSAERIRDELIRILETSSPSLGLSLLNDCGILKLILPELAACQYVGQGELHRYDVYQHLLYACDAAPQDNLVVRLAALFHDLGKPQALISTDQGEIQFHRHEQLSAVLTEKILRRLRFSNRIVNRVRHLVAQHMFHYEDRWSDAAVRRFISRVGVENIQDILSLRRADQLAMVGQRFVSGSLIALEKRIESVLAEDRVLNLRNLAVNGNDLIHELGIPRGPKIGIVLDALLESVLDDPGQNERERLLKIAKGFYETRLRED